MKVKFYFQYWDDDAYARAESDLFCVGIDCISMLLVGLIRRTEANELIQTLGKQEFEWWGEDARVCGDGCQVKIYPATESEHAVIDRETLKKVVCDWIHFLESREPAEYEY
ncbi:MAG: hypothetical protein WD397_12950 [Wenzhouxiangellaceae bacterium]